MPSFPPPGPPAPPPASPPYGLAVPAFPFPALARLAGQAQLGETRETVLACLVAARLVLATLPPYRLQPDQRRSRATAALAWLAALAVPAAIRPPLAALYEATGDGARDVGPMLDAVRDVLRDAPRDGGAAALDAASTAELDRLAMAVAAAAAAAASDHPRPDAAP